jgi:hypothetical protein
MAFEVTSGARSAAEQLTKQFNIVLEIDGVSELFGVATIKKYIRIGDPGLLIGGGWDIGGLNDVEGQSDYISYKGGTTTELTQTLKQDTGEGDTVTRYQIALIDLNKEISNLLAPGNVVTDLLGRRCTLWAGFASTAWRDDYIVVHRGIIDDFKAGHGIVTINIASPEILKKGEIFLAVETELNGAIGAGDTAINVVSTSDFLQKVTGPDGTISDKFLTYIQIENEVIEYQTLGATQFVSCSRGQLGTTAVAHADGETVTSFYRIGPIDPMVCALNLMLSGKQGPYVDSVPVSNFVRTEGTDTIANSIYFSDLNIVQLYNVSVGDYVTTTGSINSGSNDVTLKKITSIRTLNNGFAIVIEGVSFVEEIDSTATIAFRSQYDIWPTGAGLELNANEVDIAQHLDIRSNFLSNEVYDFYLKETVQGKEFIAGEVYNPVSCYSIPRKAAASVGIHRPPLPGSDIKTLSSDNVLNAGKLKIERSINKQFFNAVIYKFEELVTEDKFVKGVVNTNAESITRIPVGNKPLTIESKGLRDILSGESTATEAASRRLNKYKFGAEFVRSLQVTTEVGWTIEIGDAVVLDLASLQITDSKTGTRTGDQRLFDVINKKLNTKTGVVTLDVLDSAVDLNVRYGLQSPSSFISFGTSTTQFTIRASFNTDLYGDDEFRKWDNLQNAAVIIRSVDYSVVESSVISQFTGNTVTLTTPLTFTPPSGYIMELDIYDAQPDNVKLLYVFTTDDPTFADGGNPYAML